MLQIPVIEWPFKDGNKVQVWARTTPNHTDRMKIIGMVTRAQYKELKAQD